MQDKTHHFPKTNALPSTKTSILCSKSPKTRVPKPKKHKNPDFVLEMPENEGFGGKKRTKTPILCSGGRGLAPGKEEISFGKDNNGLPANHRACFKNANTS